MARGMSLHIGLNILDLKYYLDPKLFLLSSRKDAIDMAEIAKKNFTEPVPIYNEPNKLLLDSDATTDNVIKIMTEMAKGKNKLTSGDILLITFSGHGAQVPEIGSQMEGDGANETWSLYDRQFLDKEIFALLTNFDKGVRILIVSDSCRSGTVAGSIGDGIAFITKIKPFLLELNFNSFEEKILKVKNFEPVECEKEIGQKDKKVLEKSEFDSSDDNSNKSEDFKFKNIPPDVLDRINKDENNERLFSRIQEDVLIELFTKKKLEKKGDPRELAKASIILLSACQEWQGTRPGTDEKQNSKFTEVFKEVYAKGEFKNYLELHQRLWEFFDQNATEESEVQNPNYYKIGTPNAEFEMQIPFTV